MMKEFLDTKHRVACFVGGQRKRIATRSSGNPRPIALFVLTLLLLARGLPAAATTTAACGHIWVTNATDGTVTKLSVTDGSVVDTFPVGRSPWGIAFDGSSVWVANQADGTVSKLSAVDGSLLAIFNVPDPRYLAFDGSNMWVTNYSPHSVTKLRVGDGATLATISLPINAMNVAFDGTHVWVTSTGGTLTKIRPSDNVTLGSYAGQATYAIAVDLVDDTIWVTNSVPNTVTGYGRSDGAARGPYAVGQSPLGAMFDGENVWVTNFGHGGPNGTTVTKLHGSDGSLLGTYTVGTAPWGIAFDGANAWIANYGSNSVSELRGSDGATIGTSWVGQGPIDVVFTGECAPAVCGNGTVEPDEQCDDGNTAAGDCCGPTCQFESSATICRSSSGVCDVAENCTGSNATCPTDAKSTAVCRTAAGDCDVAESCDGVNNDCPADRYTSSATECRGVAGVCDVAENCSGNSADCPADAKSTSECRASVGECDVADACDGVGNDCPADAKSTAQCRPSVGECDIAENCGGAGNDCPPDAFQPSTTSCTTDTNLCTDDHCDGAGACVHPANTTPCDDGDQCTVNDRCSDTICAGDDVIVKPACRWVMMGGYGGTNPKRPKQVGGRIRENATVTGDICGDTVRVGGNSLVAGEIVATRSVCGGNAGVELGPNANVQDAENVIVTGGSRVIGKPLGTILPGCLAPPVTAIECEQHVVPPCPPPAYYDTTGDDDLVAECNDSRQTLASYVTDLNAVVCTAEIDPVCGKIPAGETLFIGPGGISLTDGGGGKDCLLPGGAIQEGQLNYVCLDGALIAATDSVIQIDDSGDTGTEYVLIVTGAIKLLLRSHITLDPPLDASRVLIYGKKKCYIGNEVQGAGSLVCPNSKLQVWTAVQWQGALLSGNGYVQVGDNSVVNHVPLLFSGQ